MYFRSQNSFNMMRSLELHYLSFIVKETSAWNSWVTSLVESVGPGFPTVLSVLLNGKKLVVLL